MVEEITKEHEGYRVWFNIREESAPYQIIEEKEGLITLVKGGGAVIVLHAVGEQLKIKPVSRDDILEIFEKVIGR